MKTKTVAMSQLHSNTPANMLHAPQDLMSFISAGGKLTAALDSDDDTVDPTAGPTAAGVASNPAPCVSIGTNNCAIDPPCVSIGTNISADKLNLRFTAMASG